MNAPVVEMFERLDIDGDGVISSEEMNQIPFGHRGGGHHGR
jgi:Ca2+-binding EF-hand superfamily protein